MREVLPPRHRMPALKRVFPALPEAEERFGSLVRRWRQRDAREGQGVGGSAERVQKPGKGLSARSQKKGAQQLSVMRRFQHASFKTRVGSLPPV